MSTQHWRNDTSRGNAKYGKETPLRCHSVYHNPQTISMELNSVLRGERPVTNALSHLTDTFKYYPVGWRREHDSMDTYVILS